MWGLVAPSFARHLAKTIPLLLDGSKLLLEESVLLAKLLVLLLQTLGHVLQGDVSLYFTLLVLLDLELQLGQLVLLAFAERTLRSPDGLQ